MIELTLLTLLNFVGDNFCDYRNLGHDNYKSLLLAYSDASEKYGPLEVKKIIEKSDNFKVTAIAIAKECGILAEDEGDEECVCMEGP